MVEEEVEAEELAGTSGAKRTDLDGLATCGAEVEEEAEASVLIGIEKESCRVEEGEDEAGRAMLASDSWRSRQAHKGVGGVVYGVLVAIVLAFMRLQRVRRRSGKVAKVGDGKQQAAATTAR